MYQDEVIHLRKTVSFPKFYTARGRLGEGGTFGLRRHRINNVSF